MLFLVGIIAFAQATTPKQLPQTHDAESKFLETLELLQAANLAGATNDELSGSVQKLNEALSLIESANQLEKQGQLSDANNAAQKALQILSSAQSEALALQEKAQARTQQQKLLTYVLAPIMAFLTVLVYHYGRKANRRYRITKTMNMRVRVRPNVKPE
jgi:vacuolar-type H+-ATPase subunit H